MKGSLKKQKTKKQKQKQNVISMIKFCLFTAPQFSFLHNYDVSSPQFKIKHV